MLKYNIDTLITMGKAHKLHTEDDYFVSEGDDYILAAVFDGCSSGVDSHYASTTHKYKLKSITNDLIYLLRENNNRYHPYKGTDEVLKEIAFELCCHIYNMDYEVDKEMLSTAVLLLINKKTKEYSILFCGDGCCCVDDDFHSIHDTNGNAVWYLSTVNPKDFLNYYNSYCRKFNGNIEDGMVLSISTDGIESFMTSYGSYDTSLPIDVFMKTENCDEKYHKWNLERLYNVFTKGKMNGMNDNVIRNIDDMTIIKIKVEEVNGN